MEKRQLTSSAETKSKYYTYNIMLGSACNWNCPYCIQSSRQYKQVDPNLFCDKLIGHLHKTNRIDKINTFALWGGEPLLYYDSIKVLLKRLSRLNIRDPIRIASNGSLLTEQNYDLFNQYFTKFEISYHQGQLTDDKWEVALKINRLIVSSLITHKVLDWSYYYNQWQRITDKFGRCVKWFVFPLIYAGNASSDYALTRADIDYYIDSLYRHLDDLHNVFYQTAFEGLIYDTSAKGLDKYTNYCYNDQSIAIDMYGNRYSCHHDYNNANKVGNVFDTIPITWEPPIDQACKQCKAYSICVGGCFRCKDKVNWCYYYKRLYDLLQYIKQNHITEITRDYVHLL